MESTEYKSTYRKSILCVEDNSDMCEILSIILSGYDLVSAEDLRQAYKMIENRKFDLYILDNWLPDGSGIDLCKKIRSSDAKVPIIFISGVGYKAEIQEAVNAGANKYLVKPCEPEMIEKVVKQLID